MRDAAAALSDRQARANRLIIWGHFTQKDKPTQKACSILRSLPLSFQLSSLKASWLTSKKNRGIMGILAALPTPDDVSAVLAHSDVLKQRFPLVRGLTPDRPIEERRKNPRKNTTNRFPAKQPASYSSDPKLTQKPVVHITRLSIDPENLPQDSFRSLSCTPPLAASSPSSSFLSVDSTHTPTISETPKQSNKIQRTPFLPHVRPLKRGILGPVPSTPREATESPKRPSPPPPFRPSPKKPRPPDTHRASQKHRRKKTTLKATTPAKRSGPPIPNLMSPTQQLTCPPNPYIPQQFLLTFLLSQYLSAYSPTL